MPISFHSYIGKDFAIDVEGKGLGFFGVQGSGDTLEAGEYQKTTYIVDGETPYAHINNITYYNESSGLIDGELVANLREIPNYEATLNIRFQESENTRVLNAKYNFYNGDDLTEYPLGWTIKTAEIAHIGLIQDFTGVGDVSWNTASTGEFIDLYNNPGHSGAYVGGFAWIPYLRHDWYIAISVAPQQVGSKTAGLYVYLEYL